MRVSKDVMAKNNTKIVNEAARLYREQGIEQTSVAQVMKGVGLTHGGFYRHFSSKEALVCCAIEKIFSDMSNVMNANISEIGNTQAIETFIKTYLSYEHVKDVGGGCPIAALSTEANYGPDVYRDSIERGRDILLGIISRTLADNKPKNSINDLASEIFVILLGTLAMARTFSNRNDIDKLLNNGKLKIYLY